MANANDLPVLPVSVATNSLPVDSALSTRPHAQVDYLSHKWQEEDVWRSWREMTRQKNEITGGSRLENALWRTWWKQSNKLKTVTLETPNWLKDSDATWLYGPLHTADDDKPLPKPPGIAYNDLPNSPLFSPTESDEEHDARYDPQVDAISTETPALGTSLPSPDALPKWPKLLHTKSDAYISRWGPSQAFRKDSAPWIEPPGYNTASYFPKVSVGRPVCTSLSQDSNSSASTSTNSEKAGKKKRISSNTFVIDTFPKSGEDSSPSIPATPPPGYEEHFQDTPQDLQSREIGDSPTKHQIRVAYFAAVDAQEHLEIRRADIIGALDRHKTPMVALAGFNEDAMREGNGSLLQEIHIVPSKDLALQQQDLDAVGKACSPFPAMIFMPSGETLRPPVFNSDGKVLAFEEVAQSFAFKPRFDIALKTLVAYELTDQQTQSTSDNAADGQGRNDQSRRSPPGSHRASTRSNSGNDPQPGEEGRSDEMDPIPRTTTTGEDENPPTAKGEGGKHTQAPQGSPVPGDDGATQRPHNIHFDITAAIHQPEPGYGLLQKLQLIGKFNFQVTPGQTSSIEFTKMQCQAHSEFGASYRYSQTYLKILIDSHSLRWSLDDHKPRSTRASDGQVKCTESRKTGWQQAVKAGMSLLPFGSVNAEASLSRTKERLTSNEAVRFNSRIIQREHHGVFWWSFHVDDEHEAECGVQLAEDSLPSAKMSVLPSDSPQLTQPLDKLSVEISSFWSLLGKGRGWLSYTPGNTLPPGFSNLCQVISIDLPPSGGSYVSESQIRDPGNPDQEPNVLRRSAITPTEAVLMLGGGVQSVDKGWDKLVDTSMRLIRGRGGGGFGPRSQQVT